MQLEYVWLDGKNSIRSKTKVILNKVILNKEQEREQEEQQKELDLKDIPIWNYDGSSTYQAFTDASEIFLYPMKLYPNPFVSSGYFVICKTSDPLCTVSIAEEIFTQSNCDKPMFGIEQEFFIKDITTGKPLGWPINGEPKICLLYTSPSPRDRS